MERIFTPIFVTIEECFFIEMDTLVHSPFLDEEANILSGSFFGVKIFSILYLLHFFIWRDIDSKKN